MTPKQKAEETYKKHGYCRHAMVEAMVGMSLEDNRSYRLAMADLHRKSLTP